MPWFNKKAKVTEEKIATKKEQKKIAVILDKIELKKQKAEALGEFSLFHTKTIHDIISTAKTYDAAKYIYDVVSSWEGKYHIPYSIGTSIEGIANDPNWVVCIHRANLRLNKDREGIPESDDLVSIMENGLTNYGHANAMGGSAFMEGPPDLTLTTTALKGLGGYLNLITTYKGNDTTVLMAFPKELVTDDGHIKDNNRASEIYNMKSGNATIKNDYILGALIKKNYGMDEFYSRDEIIMNGKSKTK